MPRAIVILVFLAAAAPGGQFDNPAYKSWAKFKPGSMVRVKHIQTKVKLKWVKVGDKFMLEEDSQTKKEKHAEKTRTLIEINADQAVIEVKTWNLVDGKKTETAAEKEVVPARLAKPEDEQVKEPDEEITVGGKAIKCKVASSTTVHVKTDVLVRRWTSDTVPGGVVRFVGTIDTSTDRIGVVQDVTEVVVK